MTPPYFNQIDSTEIGVDVNRAGTTGLITSHEYRDPEAGRAGTLITAKKLLNLVIGDSARVIKGDSTKATGCKSDLLVALRSLGLGDVANMIEHFHYAMNHLMIMSSDSSITKVSQMVYRVLNLTFENRVRESVVAYCLAHNIPVITIHDAIFTVGVHLNAVKSELQRISHDLFGIELGLSIERDGQKAKTLPSFDDDEEGSMEGTTCACGAVEADDCLCEDLLTTTTHHYVKSLLKSAQTVVAKKAAKRAYYNRKRTQYGYEWARRTKVWDHIAA